MSEQPQYDTRAVTLDQWRFFRGWLLADGWEHKKGGYVVYLRRHVSGPVSDDAGWSREHV
jgi:hypothetical protein